MTRDNERLARLAELGDEAASAVLQREQMRRGEFWDDEPESGVPNLDAMPESELVAFFHRYSEPTWEDATELLCINVWPDNPTEVTKNLADYAINRASSMALRARGEMVAANDCDVACEFIYEALPKRCRW